MYVRTYVCTVCMYVCMYVHMYICMYVCMYVHMYVCMYVHMYVRMYMCEYPWCLQEIFVVGTTSYVLSGLKSDTTYYFEIRASVGPFYSVWSDWISVTTESSS